MTQEQQQEIRRLRAMGEGYKRIGAILNLSVNTVKSFCRRDSAVNPLQSQEKGNQAACLRCGRPLVLIPGRRKRLHAGVPEGKRAAVRGMRKAAHGQ